MAKVLVNDISRVWHRKSAICSVDLGDCYDWVTHPIVGVAAQAFGVPFNMVRMMLTTLQTMFIYLRTGFGVSEKAYGGKKDDFLQGLGQGNGGAPPGFSIVSALMIKVYEK